MQGDFPASSLRSTKGKDGYGNGYKEIIVCEQKDEETQREYFEQVWQPRTPASEKDIEKMIEEITMHPNLPKKAYPKEPHIKPGTSAKARLQILQKFISSFEYNHTKQNYFQVQKYLGLKRVMSIAKDVINEGLPIKCIEAVFLACYLTRDMEDLVRIPIRFQSKVDSGNIYRHIVMAVEHKGKWGALGLSRKSTLMYKNLNYKSLSALITDYKNSYEECGHALDHIGLGLPFAHEIHSMLPIHWRALMLHTSGAKWSKVTECIDLYWNNIDKIERQVLTHGDFPASWVKADDLTRSTKNNRSDEKPSFTTSELDGEGNSQDTYEKNKTDAGEDTEKLIKKSHMRAWSPILIPQPPQDVTLPSPIKIQTIDNKVLEVPFPWIDPKYKDEELKSDTKSANHEDYLDQNKISSAPTAATSSISSSCNNERSRIINSV